MSRDASPSATSKSNPSHQEASSSLFERGIVTIGSNVIKYIFERLGLRHCTSKEEASQEASLFANFMEASKTFTSERQLQESLMIFLYSIVSMNFHIVESERRNEDSSRCDLVISRGASTPDGNKAIGRPAVLIELKRPLKSHPLTLSEHQDQVIRYAKELLSRHVSVATLPLVLFNGREFYLGLAEWPSFNRLEIRLDKKMFSLYDSYLYFQFITYQF